MVTNCLRTSWQERDESLSHKL